MPIWRLEPTEIESTDWRRSTYKGQVVVRAKNENEARKLASEKFDTAADVEHGQNTPMNPWFQGELVRCEQLVGSDYVEAGPDAILSPNE